MDRSPGLSPAAAVSACLSQLWHHESLVTNQSVSAGTGPNGEVSGIRWWELRDPNGSPVIFQEGTYAPGLTDGIHRWMGSIAMNSLGDIALGFSASNGTNPSFFQVCFTQPVTLAIRRAR